MLKYKDLGKVFMNEEVNIKLVAVVDEEKEKEYLLDNLDKPYMPFPATRRIDAIYYFNFDKAMVSFNYSVPDYDDYYLIRDYLRLGYYFDDWQWKKPEDEFYDELLREYNCDSSGGIF